MTRLKSLGVIGRDWNEIPQEITFGIILINDSESQILFHALFHVKKRKRLFQ